MAKVLTDPDGVTHLRGADGMSLCGIPRSGTPSVGEAVLDGVLTCPECAKIALAAIELLTKSERREWRKL